MTDQKLWAVRGPEGEINSHVTGTPITFHHEEKAALRARRLSFQTGDHYRAVPVRVVIEEEG